MMSFEAEKETKMQKALAFCISETEKNILEYYEEVISNPDDTPKTRAEIAKDMQNEFKALSLLYSMK